MKKQKRWMRVLVLLLVMATALSPALTARAAGGENRFNVVIVLDASNSMNYTDSANLRFEAIRQFTGLLAEQGNRLGAVVYSNHVSAEQAPIPAESQADKDGVNDLLQSIPAYGYTNTGEALLKAVEMLKANGDQELPSVILYLSDGNTEMPTEDELETALEQKADALQQAREDGIAIYSVCLNANQNADVTEMQQISEATGGVFREVAKAEDLREVFNMFYGMIYGTSTITLVDETFPDDGVLTTSFEVPGIGVEEVNILIYGATTSIQLKDPADAERPVEGRMVSDAFTLIKLTDVTAGIWKLLTTGIPGDQIKINMVYNTDLGVDVTAEPKDQAISSEQELTVRAVLTSGAAPAQDGSQYAGYEAELQIFDAYGAKLRTVPMTVSGSCFEAALTFQPGAYFYQVHVSGHYLEKDSQRFGPLKVAEPSRVEEEKTTPNTPPVPVAPVVEQDVYIWPFRGASTTVDLKTLATDQEDSTLRFQIISSSFLEGTDYHVDGSDILTQDHFSLKKGSYTVRATDSGGLSCDVEVIIRTHNVGLMALIGLGAAALVVLAVMGILLYIALSKPFRGDLAVQSYVNGVYRGTPRTGRRGRIKLSAFGLDNVGLNYSKSYFQATGEQYVYLVTDVPVCWNGQRTNKVRIQSGAEVTVAVSEGDPRMLYIRFTSRMSGPRRRGPAPRRR